MVQVRTDTSIKDIQGRRVEQVFKVVQCVGTYPSMTITPLTSYKPIIQDVEEPSQPTTPTIQRQMFPTPLQRVKLTQVLTLRLQQLIHQVNKRLDRVTLLLLLVLLVVAGLRDQVGVTDTNYESKRK